MQIAGLGVWRFDGAMRVFGFLLIVGTLMLGGLLLLPEQTNEARRDISNDAGDKITDENSVITSERKLPREPIRSEIRDVTPPDALPGPKPDAPEIERLPRFEPTAEEIPEKPEPVRFAQNVIKDAGSFTSGDTHIEFAGIEALAVETTCTDGTGKVWPCGKFARTALRAFVRARAINCETALGNGKRNCRLGEIDISHWLIRNGWARTSDAKLQKLMDEAKEQKRGIWREERP